MDGSDELLPVFQGSQPGNPLEEITKRLCIRIADIVRYLGDCLAGLFQHAFRCLYLHSLDVFHHRVRRRAFKAPLEGSPAGREPVGQRGHRQSFRVVIFDVLLGLADHPVVVVLLAFEHGKGQLALQLRIEPRRTWMR